MKLLFSRGLLLAGALSLTGCATITSDGMQNVSVSTKSSSGSDIAGAKCTLKNDKGDWSVVTPAVASVRKSSRDLKVECKKGSMPAGTVNAISRAGAGLYGNILFGGAIGAVIDHSKGTAYNYADNLVVTMGKVTVIDRRNYQEVAAADSKDTKEEN